MIEAARLPPSDATGLDCDVAIVGAGPAGLSAAVYGASEGSQHRGDRPRCARRPGRHELPHPQLPRFPRGLSGGDLTIARVRQAWLFGAEFLLAPAWCVDYSASMAGTSCTWPTAPP